MADKGPRAELDKGPLLKLQSEGLIDRPAALGAVMAFLLEEVDEAFENQGWRGGTKWTPRAVPNVAGIVRDLETSSTLRKRRLQDGPVLQDTGRLRGSWNGRIDEEEGSVVVGTNVPYAEKLQNGSKSVLPGAGKTSPKKDPIRKNLFLLLKKNPDPKLKKQLSWLFGVGTFEIEPHPRKLVEATSEIVADVKEIIKGFRQFPKGEK